MPREKACYSGEGSGRQMVTFGGLFLRFFSEAWTYSGGLYMLRRMKHPGKSVSVDRMFRAFSDRTRLRLLNMLGSGEVCVCDLVAVLDVPQPKVSRHLAYLRRAGLVVARKEGLWMHYRLARAT